MSELQAERPAAAPAGRVRAHLREPYLKLFACQLLTGGVALVANVLMVRALTPAHRGEVALLLQVVYLGTQAVLLGTERSFVAGYHGIPPAAGVRAYARLVAVPAGVALAATVVWTAVAPDRLDPGPLAATLLVGFVLVETGGLAVRSIAIAAGRVGDFLASRVAEAVLLLGLLTALFLADAGHQIRGRPEAWFAAYLVAGALPTAAYIVRWLRRPAAAAPSDRTRQVRREGLALVPAALSNMAMLRADRLALPALASTSALGLYASVATMTELLAWPVRAFADARLGRWRAAHDRGRLRGRPVLLGTALYAAVLVPVAAAGLYLLIVPVFGQAYAPARAVVVPLVAAAGLYAVSRVGLGLLIARGRGGLVSAAEITGFVVSFAGYLLLIPPYGIAGAAYGSLAGYGACLLFALAAGRRAGRRRAGRRGGAP